MKNYLGKQIYQSIFYPLLFVMVLWLVYWMQKHFGSRFVEWGVLPRTASGLRGVITSVFIHADIEHLASNSLPLIVLGMMLFYFYKKIAHAAFLWIWLISGLWLWIGGRNGAGNPSYHIGASTLIYGLAAFLFFSGVFRRHLQLMVVSALVLFLYGSIVWGVFPFQPQVSWEGHLFGSLAGILVAFNYRSEGPKRKIYDWENETDDDDEHQNPGSTNEADTGQNITIHYIYREKGEEGKGES